MLSLRPGDRVDPAIPQNAGRRWLRNRGSDSELEIDVTSSKMPQSVHTLAWSLPAVALVRPRAVPPSLPVAVRRTIFSEDPGSVRGPVVRL